jgi:hypothetical protein
VENRWNDQAPYQRQAVSGNDLTELEKYVPENLFSRSFVVGPILESRFSAQFATLQEKLVIRDAPRLVVHYYSMRIFLIE